MCRHGHLQKKSPGKANSSASSQTMRESTCQRLRCGGRPDLHAAARILTQEKEAVARGSVPFPDLRPFLFREAWCLLRQSGTAFTTRINERVCLYRRDMSRSSQHPAFPTGVGHCTPRTSVEDHCIQEEGAFSMSKSERVSRR